MEEGRDRWMEGVEGKRGCGSGSEGVKEGGREGGRREVRTEKEGGRKGGPDKG